MRRYKPHRPKPTTDARPPEARLEAVVRESNPDRAERMLARIAQDLDAAAEPAPWIYAARTLSDRLIISECTYYYFVSLFTESLIFAASANDPELMRLVSEVEAIERDHGLREDEEFIIGQEPPEWIAANDAWEHRADGIIAAYLRAHGHADVASLVETNRADFEARARAGYHELWGDDDDADEGDRP